MKPLFLTLSLTTVLSACQNGPITTVTNLGPSSTSSPSKILTFQNTDYFDTQLSEIVAGQQQMVEIPVSEAFEPDKGETPERLAKWVGVLKDGGGKQDYEEIKDPNGMNPLITILLPVLVDYATRLWQNYQERQKYLPIQNYDARFCFRKYDNKVEKLVFVRKEVDRNKAVCFR